ncbi:FRG domain-containing protein [Terribacillus sp. DMT04]|uniref:FRG domain-containing protein n=1 Tax=Terribacillus sp. DMT04 TaxID=2850441 RepID=UPI001C2C3181|nr:FRG domain-containing protein [Terribacillus sp. DMT04]QXE01742.1 FRG domain-containing protein [Terribacillus sp. DMT04]
MWKEIQIENWQHFVSLIHNDYGGSWIFRGQSSTEWDLETSFYRECKKSLGDYTNREGLTIEKSIYKEFRSSYKLYSATHIIEHSQNEERKAWLEARLGYLSMMQHYGTPTRLLDWTYSPYIAAFFAIDSAMSDFCVYTIDSTALEKYYSKKLGRVYFSADYRYKALAKISTRDNNHPYVWFHEPLEKNERIRKQQGLFLVPSVLDKSIQEILEANGMVEGKLDGNEVGHKLIFKKDQINECWSQLKKMNITHETIYPGLEGFCKSLKLNIINNN